MAIWLSKIRHSFQRSWRYISSQLRQLSKAENRKKLLASVRRFDFSDFARHAISWLKKSYYQLTTKYPVLKKNAVIVVILLLPVLVIVTQINFGHSLDDLKQAGELVVISRESPTTWYEDGAGPTGPEYDYLASFAEFLGVKLRFDIRDNSQQVIDQVADGKGHLGAAGLIRHPALEKHGLVFGPELQKVDEKVVCRRNNGQLPRNIDELADYDLVVVADSTYEASLEELQQDHDELSWESASDTDVEQLLEQVGLREIDCTVASSSALNIKRRFYPELQTAFTIEKNQSLAWMLSPEWTVLADAIDD